MMLMNHYVFICYKLITGHINNPLLYKLAWLLIDTTEFEGDI